jgi:hypothetical protein
MNTHNHGTQKCLDLGHGLWRSWKFGNFNVVSIWMDMCSFFKEPLHAQ